MDSEEFYELFSYLLIVARFSNKSGYNLGMFPPDRPSVSWRWLPWAIFALAVVARLLPGPRTIDDSFITYRYARNLLQGSGFTYNPGERVLGTTTPLYTLLMASLALPTGGTQAPFATLSMCVNALADGFTCLLLWRLGGYLGTRFAGPGAALVWAIAPFSVTFAIGGLETSLYVLLLVGTVTAHLEQRRTLAAGLGALSLLTRPDALILLGPLALDRLLQALPRFGWGQTHGSTPTAPANSPIRLTELLAFCLPVLGWIVFASLYFGSPLPHSIAAKSLAYRQPPEASLVRLIQHYATPFMEDNTFGGRWIMVGMVLYPFLYMVGALRAWRADRHTWVFAAYPWLYLIVFAAANPLIFRWYLTPPLPAWFLFSLAGLETLLFSLAAALKRKDSQAALAPPGRLARATALVLVVLTPTLLSLSEWTLHPDHGANRPAPDMAFIQVELLYRQTAELLAPKLRAAGPDAVLAAGDVGVLGFYTGARILDTVGLNSPESTRYYPLDPQYYVINYAVPPNLILDKRPNYVVILEVYGRAGLLKDPRFQAQYHLLQKLPTDLYGSDGLLILERNQ